MLKSRPCLLIEFDSKRPFTLTGSSELSGEISERNVVSRTAGRVHFPPFTTAALHAGVLP